MKSPKFNFKPTLLSVVIAGAVLSACSSNTESLDKNTNASVDELIPTAVRVLPKAEIQISKEVVYSADVEELVIQAERRDATSTSVSLGLSSQGQFVSARAMQMLAPQMYDYSRPELNQENYADFDDEGITRVVDNRVSTFSIDVDTGAYSNVRRFLNNGSLPPADAVRAEELINYFSYNYNLPQTSSDPFSFSTEVSVSPWNADKHLVHIGLQALEPDASEQMGSNLVFLLDVSGSMNSPDKLGLLKTSLKMLTRELDEDDRVSIVVYAGASGVVLRPTAGNETRQISAALDRLSAGGGTNGEAGIHLAYALAQEAFIEAGINRIILATDGDFNVGTSDVEALKDLISEKREQGISLTTLGFGTGNYNDHLMEQIADVGNGNYAYIDNVNEARKVLVDEMQSTLQTVAKDVKIQIEFNPALVSEYRLIGYENRALKQEDFNNDKIDAGEIGAGHTVTAIYEISLVGSSSQSVDPLRYSNTEAVTTDFDDLSNELAYLKLRYKEPSGTESKLLSKAIYANEINANIANTSNNYRFSAAVAGLAQLLRDNKVSADLDYESVLALANNAKGDDEFGYRSEFISLVRTAQILSIN